MPSIINNDDEVSRYVEWPKDYLDKGIGCLDIGLNLYFRTEKKYSESVNCSRFLSDPINDNHKLGLEKLKKAKEKYPNKSKSEYRGFVSAKVANIRDAAIEGVTVDVIHTPVIEENNVINPAHCDIQLSFSNMDEIRSQRQNASAILSSKFGPLQEYTGMVD